MHVSFATQLDQVAARVEVAHRADAKRDIDRLRELGVQSRDDLWALARDRHVSTMDRQTAVWAIGRIGDRDGAKVLDHVLDDEDAEVRAAAARALGELGAEDAGDHLTTVLQDDAALPVRQAAAYALGLIGYAPALTPLLDALEDARQNASFRGMVAEAIADLGDKSAVPGLVQALSDDAAEVRYFAAYALGRLGTSEVLPALEARAHDTAEVAGFGTVAEESAQAMSSIRDRETRGG